MTRQQLRRPDQQDCGLGDSGSQVKFDFLSVFQRHRCAQSQLKCGVEYMAAGRCILASDLPVLREVLHHASAAFYQPEDFSDLCAQFAGLISDTQKREALAAAAKEDVKAYSWRRRMTGIMRAIRNLTGKQEPKLDYNNL